MTVPTIAFFNNKGGVGKTSLLYHVAWMLAERGHRVVAADLDPQANLSAAFLDEDVSRSSGRTNETFPPSTVRSCRSSAASATSAIRSVEGDRPPGADPGDMALPSSRTI